MNKFIFLAVLDFKDYAFIAGIVAIFAGGAAYTSRQQISLAVMERQMRELQQKMDAVLKYHGIELPKPPPSGLSREVELLAGSPNTKIAAIRLYRKENPGVDLAAAKARIEAYYNSIRSV